MWFRLLLIGNDHPFGDCSALPVYARKGANVVWLLVSYGFINDSLNVGNIVLQLRVLFLELHGLNYSAEQPMKLPKSNQVYIWNPARTPLSISWYLVISFAS